MKSPGESSSTGTGGGGLGFHTNLLERQGSIQGRERMIAHSTALESITAEVDSMSIGNTPCNTTGNAGNVISQVQITPGKELLCVGIKGQLISKRFFGVIDFLQKTNENKST